MDCHIDFILICFTSSAISKARPGRDIHLSCLQLRAWQKCQVMQLKDLARVLSGLEEFDACVDSSDDSVIIERYLNEENGTFDLLRSTISDHEMDPSHTIQLASSLPFIVNLG